MRAFAPTRSMSRRGRVSRLVAALFVALRLLVMIVSVQSTGVLHVVADVFAEVVEGSAHRTKDCDDESGPECPPGCPSCHCLHGMVAVDPLPPADVSSLRPPVPEREVTWWVDTQTVPSGAQTSVFRPPRVAGFLS